MFGNPRANEVPDGGASEVMNEEIRIASLAAGSEPRPPELLDRIAVTMKDPRHDAPLLPFRRLCGPSLCFKYRTQSSSHLKHSALSILRHSGIERHQASLEVHVPPQQTEDLTIVSGGAKPRIMYCTA